jgi:hypothetical protein
MGTLEPSGKRITSQFSYLIFRHRPSDPLWEIRERERELEEVFLKEVRDGGKG